MTLRSESAAVPCPWVLWELLSLPGRTEAAWEGSWTCRSVGGGGVHLLYFEWFMLVGAVP